MNHRNMNALKTFRRIGLALFTATAISCVLQTLLIFLAGSISAGDSSLLCTTLYLWLATFVPLYAVAIPAGL